jgi:urea transport system ATP-binding protein
VTAGLAFQAVTTGYGTTPVIRGVSGAVAPGEVLCVLGRNGVGKTTLMKVIFGYLRCWEGQVVWNGAAIETLDPSTRRWLGISYCPQERPVFDDLSVRDNLMLIAPNRGLAGFGRYFSRFPVLEARLEQAAGTLSGGEKKLLSFVRGLAEDQPAVLLDEPSEGVQWENILQMRELIVDKKTTGVALIVVEQNLAFAELIADRYLVMDQGRVVLEGPSCKIGRTRLLEHLRV